MSGLVIGRQGGRHESYLSHVGKGFCHKPFLGTQKWMGACMRGLCSRSTGLRWFQHCHNILCQSMWWQNVPCGESTSSLGLVEGDPTLFLIWKGVWPRPGPCPANSNVLISGYCQWSSIEYMIQVGPMGLLDLITWMLREPWHCESPWTQPAQLSSSSRLPSYVNQ